MRASAPATADGVAEVEALPSRMELQRPDAAPTPDDAAWIAALRRKDGAAIVRLHELLQRASRFEVSRRRASLAFVRGEELDDLATAGRRRRTRRRPRQAR